VSPTAATQGAASTRAGHRATAVTGAR
jgi:hypothetical protein